MIIFMIYSLRDKHGPQLKPDYLIAYRSPSLLGRGIGIVLSKDQVVRDQKGFRTTELGITVPNRYGYGIRDIKLPLPIE